MDTQTITMPGYMGKPWDVTGQCKGGLILHKMGKRWVVSCIASGMRVGEGRDTKTAAKAKMNGLLELLPDWSSDGGIDCHASIACMTAREFVDTARARGLL